jgi:hypothetical protein
VPDNPPPPPQTTPCPEEAQPRPHHHHKERRVLPRESTPATPPHTAENASEPDPNVPIAPHMAEPEPVTEAEFVTVKSPKGKTTIFVERAPGKAAHATVVGENNDPPETKGDRRRRKRAERKSRMIERR